MDDVVVIGGGVSGLSCARRLSDRGVPVRVVDRGRVPGGRLGVRRVAAAGTGPGDDGRPVDTGAAYFTAADEDFSALVADWQGRGLARGWTHRLRVMRSDGGREDKVGPLRWAAPDGLRSLAHDLCAGLDVTSGRAVRRVGGPTRGGGPVVVDGEPAAAVVLAMPTPQATRLLAPELAEALGQEIPGLVDDPWSPVLSWWARYDHRWWDDLDVAVVADSPIVATIADDGRRRGDDAPVLVAHSTSDFAAARLTEPATGCGPIRAAVADLLSGPDAGGVPLPVEEGIQRWGLARPERSGTHASPFDAPFHLGDAWVGLAGDGWGGKPRVEAAWLSGRRLADQLADRLA